MAGAADFVWLPAALGFEWFSRWRWPEPILSALLIAPCHSLIAFRITRISAALGFVRFFALRGRSGPSNVHPLGQRFLGRTKPVATMALAPPMLLGGGGGRQLGTIVDDRNFINSVPPRPRGGLYVMRHSDRFSRHLPHRTGRRARPAGSAYVLTDRDAGGRKRSLTFIHVVCRMVAKVPRHATEPQRSCAGGRRAPEIAEAVGAIAPSDTSIRRLDHHPGAFEPGKNHAPGSDQRAAGPLCPTKEPFAPGTFACPQTPLLPHDQPFTHAHPRQHPESSPAAAVSPRCFVAVRPPGTGRTGRGPLLAPCGDRMGDGGPV